MTILHYENRFKTDNAQICLIFLQIRSTTKIKTRDYIVFTEKGMEH